MAAKPLLPVSDALAAIQSALTSLPAEPISVSVAHKRYLAKTHYANLSHPTYDVSAMDGYAARSEDVAQLPASLKVVDESAAGRPALKSVGTGEAIRIFTGAVIPDGANCVIIQEDTIQNGEYVTIEEVPKAGQYIRKAGQDYRQGDALVFAGKQLSARDIALLASGGLSEVSVLSSPRIAILNSGDELVNFGAKPARGQLINSNGTMLAAMITAFGGKPVDLGILPDRSGALDETLSKHGTFDLIVTTGGASVGAHDHIIGDLEKNPQCSLNFWRIAMRPGKPLIFADWQGTPLLGLPGNPVSTGVCTLLFVQAAIAKLQGRDLLQTICSAQLAAPLPENDRREDYIRTEISTGADGTLIATPAKRQDSAMLSYFAGADGLIVRPPFAEALDAGDTVKIIRFPDGF